ncbi:MAG: prepilin-type N-terminal cleavage/methylation domain-containing protein [Candidatus Omnitrophica bacterium]|nr:prepilin-type N-terminal cleavage/methylation domain-containing protein [Candidatus Omnitrophota bacterium]
MLTTLLAGKKGQRGLTLLELMIAVTLLGLVTVSFAYLYGTSQRFLVQSVNISSVQGEAAFALEHIQRNLSRATALSQPADGNTGGTLEFSWQPTITAALRASRYELSGTDLRFIPDTANAGVFEVIARNITGALFARADPSVSMQITSQRNSGGDTRDTTLRTTVSPRGL